MVGAFLPTSPDLYKALPSATLVIRPKYSIGFRYISQASIRD